MLEPYGELYRIGGDEFIIMTIFEKKDKDNKTTDLIELLAKRFEEPVQIEEAPLDISFSMGLASYPYDGTKADELLKKSDIAMYRSKATQKGTLTVFNDNMLQNLTKRKEITEMLRGAVDNNEFYLHFQPQVYVQENMAWGVEALIRWNNPKLGFVSPGDFIEIAEEGQEIIKIGQWVLEESCKFIKTCQNEESKGVKISVNISPVQLIQENFVDLVFETLDRYDVDYSFLEIEVTESIMVESYEVIYSTLSKLRDKGIKVAIDDFGTGYSSLSYLTKLPIDTIKIDKSFVDDIERDSRKKHLVTTVIEMAKIMNLELVIEGVETKKQYEYFASIASARVQGYYIAKPMPKKQVLSKLKELTN
ncbi:bifunctional diguanylate cyclase/phosphodiesterase [Proteinivorax hydrogeniformans]|uniref:Bifunctional diguanylate cyclase/phosphodiesterase n=1 Tax=Proteinivorax hydrogeniformans TaxID=1826727 RepID=A0AAU8HUM7_9FIRM